ncbi:MAG TPA: hypothetical protein VF950_24225 [Planctomycetota bacterium]
MTRSLLTLRELAGTVHAPADAGPGRIGFLLLNAGPAPRSGNSDLSARLGDRLAALGAYAFRFDLPGLGDSAGELPERTSVFWRDVQRGRNDEPALELGRELKEAYGLRGLVAGGLCAGAITSIRAADRDPRVFSGLLLLEPSFRREPEPRAPLAVEPRLLRRGLLYLTMSRVLRPLRPLLFRCLAFEGGHSLPRDLDPELVACWRRTLGRRVPTFVAMARSGDREHPCRRILDELPLYRRRAVTDLMIEGSNHLFTWGDGLEAVVRGAGRWAAAYMASFAPSPGGTLRDS